MAGRGVLKGFAVLLATALLALSAGCENAVDQVDVRDSIQAWEAAQED